MRDIIKNVLLNYTLLEGRPAKINMSNEDVIKLLNTYTVLSDFVKENPEIYQRYRKKDWFKYATQNLIKTKQTFWTPERVTQESQKYNNRNDFRTNSPTAYRWAIKYELFGDTILHLGDTQDRKDAGYWDYEKLKAEALKYQSKKEFIEKNQGAVSTAKHMGIWDEITAHMETLGSLYQRAVYAWEFPDNSVYVGLTFNLELRGSQHLDPEGKTQVSKHIKQTGLIPIFVLVSDFVDQTEAQNLENCTVEDYRSKGWNILNKVKTGGLGSCRRRWTYDALKDEASKYDNVGDFKKYSYSAYVSAQKYGFFDELTKDMKRRGK
jgi:hypothetical protein